MSIAKRTNKNAHVHTQLVYRAIPKSPVSPRNVFVCCFLPLFCLFVKIVVIGIVGR